MLNSSSGDIAKGLRAVSALDANGGNGGEAACLRALLAMKLDAVYFLGDGGWDSGALIEAARSARGTTIHSIAFFTTGGGLEEIASMTGGARPRQPFPRSQRAVCL